MSAELPANHHERYMDMAIAEARKAEALGEVPVGSVIVNKTGEVIGHGCNRVISSHDPTAHAEILALRDAALRIANYRISGAVMYCTVEPCAMCAGAMVHARIAEAYFGTPDFKAGAAGSLYNILDDPRLNHRIRVVRGVRDKECELLLQQFFARKRASP